jgi:predicted nucleic acid-binding protein
MAISALTLAELTVGPKMATDDLMRVRREGHLQRIATNLETLSFDPICAHAYGVIYATVARRGRKARGGRAVDLMIAATAFAHRLPLYTLNSKDLRGLEGLVEIVDVSR